MALNGTPGPDSLSARFDGDLVYGLGGRDVLTSYGYNDTYLDGGDDNDQLLSNFDLVNAPIIAGGSGGAGQPTVILTQAGGLGNDSLRAPIYEDDASERETEVTTRLNLTGGDGIDNITATITSADWSYLLSSIWSGIGGDSIRVDEYLNGYTKYSTMDQTIRVGEGDDQVDIHTSGGFFEVVNNVLGEAGNDTIFAEAVAGDWEGVYFANRPEQYIWRHW